MAGVMRYESHHKLTKLIMRELLRAPPHGYHAVTHEQAQRAGRETWRIVAQLLAASPLTVRDDGVHPAAVALEQAIEKSR
eukprot:1570656-Amphidinium_carterae.1